MYKMSSSTLLYIYNTSNKILADYSESFKSFFERKNIDLFVHCETPLLVDGAREIFPQAKITHSNTAKTSYDLSFFDFLRQIFLYDSWRNYSFFYRICTKESNQDIHQLIFNWNIIENISYWPSFLPVIYGAKSAIYENNKLYHRSEFIAIANDHEIETKSKKSIYEFVDKYTVEKPNSHHLQQTIFLNPKFYKFYEPDLRRVHSDMNYMTMHWENHGKSEGHRLYNPIFVSSFGKTNFFVSESNFCFNQTYMTILEKINWFAEYQQDRTSAWEQMFAVLAYCNDGRVFGVENGAIYDEHYKNDTFDLSIYKEYNTNIMNCMSDDSYINHYKSVGWKENRVFSINSLKKPQVIISNPEFDANVAYFLKFPASSANIKNIKNFIEAGVKMDIYVDTNNTSMFCKGFCITSASTKQIEEEIIGKELEGQTHVCNFILGFSLVKKYKSVFAPEQFKTIENADKVINQKVFNFLDKENIFEFIREYI